MMEKRAVLYARGTNMLSVNRQLEGLRAYAQKCKFVVVGERYDLGSAAPDQSPGLCAARSLVESREADEIIACDLNAISREAECTLKFLRETHEKGVPVHFSAYDQENLLPTICKMYDHILACSLVNEDGLRPTPGTRRLEVTVQCLTVYNSGIDVPADLTLEEAIQYAKEHLDEIPLGELEYIPGSDELDEGNCCFADEEESE